MNCAQVKELLVDFLYEELPPHLRAAFAEHLRGCPGCSAEVASHRKALGQARAALSGPLLQEPPARVHAAVLAAARQARATKAGEPVPARRAAARQDDPGFLARFWRTPWLLPAFGAVSVATAVFLVKVLKNPEVLPGQRPRPVEEVVAPAATAPSPAAQPAAAPEPLPPVGAPEAEAEAAAAAKDLRGVGRGAALSGRRGKASAKAPGKAEAAPRLGGSGAASRFAEPPPPRPATKASRDVDDLLKSFDDRRPAAAADTEAAMPARAKKSSGASGEGAGPGDEPTGGAPEPLARMKPSMPQSREYAAPPAVPAVAPASGAPPSPARAMRTKQADLQAEKAPMESTAGTNDAQQTSAGGARHKGASSLEEASKKADRLFAAQDWSAAAEAYRELLRRFPDHKDASKWRERIGQSLVAEQERRRANEGKAAKAAKTTDVLKGDSR